MTTIVDGEVSEDELARFVNPNDITHKPAYNTWLDAVGHTIKAEHVGFLCYVQRNGYVANKNGKTDRPAPWTLRNLAQALGVNRRTVASYIETCEQAGFLIVGETPNPAEPNVYVIVADPDLPMNWDRILERFGATCRTCRGAENTPRGVVQKVHHDGAESAPRPDKECTTTPYIEKRTLKTPHQHGDHATQPDNERADKSLDEEEVRKQVTDLLTTAGIVNPTPTVKEATAYITATNNGWPIAHMTATAREGASKTSPRAWFRKVLQNWAETYPPLELRQRPAGPVELSPDAAALDDYFDRQLAEQQQAAEQWKQQKAHNQ